jgi:hypothetical protein
MIDLTGRTTDAGRGWLAYGRTICMRRSRARLADNHAAAAAVGRLTDGSMNAAAADASDGGRIAWRCSVRDRSPAKASMQGRRGTTTS